MYSKDQQDQIAEMVAFLVQKMQTTGADEFKQLLRDRGLLNDGDSAHLTDDTKKLIRAFFIKVVGLGAEQMVTTLYFDNPWLVQEFEAGYGAMQAALEHDHEAMVAWLLRMLRDGAGDMFEPRLHVPILAMLAARPEASYRAMVLQLSNGLSLSERTVLLEQAAAWAKANHYNQAEPFLLELLQASRATQALVTDLSQLHAAAEKQQVIARFFTKYHQYLHHVSFFDFLDIPTYAMNARAHDEALADVVAALFAQCCQYNINLRDLSVLVKYSAAQAKLPLLQNLLQFYGQSPEERAQLELPRCFWDMVHDMEQPTNANYLRVIEFLLQYFRDRQWPMHQDLPLEMNFSVNLLLSPAPVVKLLFDYNYATMDEIMFYGLSPYVRDRSQPYFLYYLLEYDNYRHQITVADYQPISRALWKAMCAYRDNEPDIHKSIRMLPPMATVNLMIKACLRDRNARLLEVFCEQAEAAFLTMPQAMVAQIKPLLEKARAQMKISLQLERAQKLKPQFTAAQAEYRRQHVDYAVLQAKFAAICHVIDIASEADLMAQLQHLYQLPATKLAASTYQVALKIDGIFGCEQLPVLIMANQDKIVVGYEATATLPPALQNLMRQALNGRQVEFVAMPLAELPIFKVVKPGPGNGGGQ